MYVMDMDICKLASFSRLAPQDLHDPQFTDTLINYNIAYTSRKGLWLSQVMKENCFIRVIVKIGH